MSTFLERLHAEKNTTQTRLNALNVFLESPFADVSDNELAIMGEQAKSMAVYVKCLAERIALHTKKQDVNHP